jgi:uncharacterized membrane protein
MFNPLKSLKTKKMKKIYSVIVGLLLTTIIWAQAPEKMSFQAVVRNSSNALVVNKTVGMRLSILQSSVSGTAVYVETQNPTTNANGLASLEIGGGTVVSGAFAAIDWSTGPYFIKTETDLNGGSNYSISGTSQLLSVPYALFAGNVAKNGGKQTLVLSDDVTDAQAAAIIAAEVGPNTQEIKIIGTTQLTQVDLSMIKTAIEIVVDNNEVLTTVNLSGLTRMDGDISFNDCPLLSNLNLSSLEKITTGYMHIENTALTSLNFTKLQKLNGEVFIEENSQLTTVSFTLTKLSGDLEISDNPILTSISFNNLLTTDDVSIGNNNALNNVSFPVLTTNEDIGFYSNASLNAISFPVLTTNGSISFRNNASLNAISFPVLTTNRGISFDNNASLNAISFPVLTTLSSGIYLNNNPSLNSFSANQLTTVGGFYVSQNPLLSSFIFPSLTTITGSNNQGFYYINSNAITANPFPALTSFTGQHLSMSGNKLTSAAVNSILARLVSISPALTGKEFYLSGQTPPAPPTGAGITNKQTLINNGNQVYTD